MPGMGPKNSYGEEERSAPTVGESESELSVEGEVGEGADCVVVSGQPTSSAKWTCFLPDGLVLVIALVAAFLEAVVAVVVALVRSAMMLPILVLRIVVAVWGFFFVWGKLVIIQEDDSVCCLVNSIRCYEREKNSFVPGRV
jgi:hypothetical protein